MRTVQCLLNPGISCLKRLPVSTQKMIDLLKPDDDFSKMARKTLKRTLLFLKSHHVPDPTHLYTDYDGWPVIRWNHVVLYWYSDNEINIFLTTCLTLDDIPKYRFREFNDLLVETLINIIK